MTKSGGRPPPHMARGASAGRGSDREVFAKRYAPVVRAYLRARWKGAPLIQDVDDAVQDVFVECFKQALGRARESGDGAAKRVELLQLRFQDGLPIREIAKRWNEDLARLHHEYAKARREFRAALLETASFHHGGAVSDIEEECVRLVDLFD